MRAVLRSLEEALGYVFTDRELAQRALTHSSLVHEKVLAGGGEHLQDNEQLEFLGDAVLGFLISEFLFKSYPEQAEGRLSKMKAHLVSAAHLHGIACDLDIGRYLQLGRGEEMSGGRAKKNLVVDALEALIAVIYLDGGMDAVRAFVAERIIGPALAQTGSVEEQGTLVDFRSALQELIQSRKLPQARYSIVDQSGPEHSKIFTVEVRVGKEWVGQAQGGTKKSAAQQAAREVYERILQEK